MEQIAHDNRLLTIDLSTAYDGEEAICFADNAHPNNRGNYLIVRKVFKALADKLITLE